VGNHAEETEMEFFGEIANMVEAAQTVNSKGETALKEAASLENYRSSVKVVAGARTQRESLIVTIDL
jgi:hypothetical protein